MFAVVFTGIAAFDGFKGSAGLQLPNEAPSKARAKVAETRLFKGRENGKRMSVGAKISASFRALSRPVFPVDGAISSRELFNVCSDMKTTKDTKRHEKTRKERGFMATKILCL